MSRSGYTDDYDEQFPNAGALYARNIERAAAGRRGQGFFRDLVAALDAMPDKRLIAQDLIRDGEVCALGALGVARGVDMIGLNPEDTNLVGGKFGIAACLAREIVFQNDEAGDFWGSSTETPEARWQRMRHWASSQIKQ
jgi:hypothetical protein